jgi:hypothetical protein
MQGARIYSALSLAEVIKQLMIYRASGMLTIRPAGGVHREQAHITIEHGYPVRIRWGMYEDDARESTLGMLNAWGEIHFMFQLSARLLQLPPPLQLPRQEQSRLLNHPAKLTQSRPNISESQPLPPIPKPTDKILAGSQHMRAGKTPKQAKGTFPLRHGNLHAIAPETVIPSLTPNAREFPVTELPRHDGTIFLLIDGHRTAADLISLTKRSLADIYNTLYNLRDQQLITIATDLTTT